MPKNESKSNMDSEKLLIVGNFPSDTEYAWNTISEYFVALGEMFLRSSRSAIICYPSVRGIPSKFESKGIMVLEFDFSSASLTELYRFIKINKIRYIYFTDRPKLSIKYLVCRMAGVRKIILHDRTSGHRDEPRFFKKMIKTILNRYPILSVDIVVGISDFVRQRVIRVSCFPEERCRRIWNGVDTERFSPGEDDFVYKEYKIPRAKKIIFTYSRANQYKGIKILIDVAYDLIHIKKKRDLSFLFCGDGPDLEKFRSQIVRKNLQEHFLCPGQSRSVDRILKGVALVVVPSLWEEGFGLSVAEAKATGKVVIASRVGGIVELINDSIDGYLIPPGDARALAIKILEIMSDTDLRKKVGEKARQSILLRFDLSEKKKELTSLFQDVCFDGASSKKEELWQKQ